MKNDSGRTLMEMLGILAIMGLLSLVAVKAYMTAMRNHRANELIYEANKRAAVVAMQFASGKTTASALEFSGHSTFPGGTFEDTAAISLESGQFKIKMNALSPDMCEKLQQMVGEDTKVRGVECNLAKTGRAAFVFNEDLSTKGFCALNERISDCICPKHRDTTGGICGPCLSGEDWGTWHQPLLTSNTSYGELTASNAVNATGTCTGNSHGAWCAFDGSLASQKSKWLTSYLNATLMWHLPEFLKIKVSEVKFVAADVAHQRFPDTIMIYGSNDGATWDQIGSGEFFEKPVAGESRTVDCDDSKSYEYLKWNFTNSNYGANRGISFAEIQISAKVFREVDFEYDPTTHTCVEQN